LCPEERIQIEGYLLRKRRRSQITEGREVGEKHIQKGFVKSSFHKIINPYITQFFFQTLQFRKQRLLFLRVLKNVCRYEVYEEF
jgi:hypothetical protein